MRNLLTASALITIVVSTSFVCTAEEPTREGDWMRSKDPTTGVTSLSMELRLPAVAEPKPALSVEFVPADHKRSDGNSAMFYLKSTGFFEQTHARKLLTEYYQKASKQANESGKSMNQLPPYVWLDTPPEQLPIKEVKEFLQFTAFQPQFLREATMRRDFSMDRQMENVDDPIAYLLPEIQAFRETARMQSMRTRLALAEGRVDDAVEIVGQQFAMANHLCQDDFIVSALVGLAVQGIAWEDTLYVLQHADAPNLYWAFAAIPKPDMTRAYSFERDIFYKQLKELREVTEEPRPVEYWNEVIDLLIPKFKSLGIEGLSVIDGNASPEVQRAQFVMYIGAAYPAARRYLIEDIGLEPGKVDAYPTTQTVLLAICRFHDRMRDEMWKWTLVAPGAANRSGGFALAERKIQSESKRIGFAAEPATLLLPAVGAMTAAESRAQMQMAMTQTVAAIQDHAANHNGQLPRSLEELRLPAPVHPGTGEALDYELVRGRGILTGKSRYIRYTLVLMIEG